MPPCSSPPRSQARTSRLATLLLAGTVMATLGSGCASTSRQPTEASSGSAGGDQDLARIMDRYYLHTCPMCGGLLGAKGEAVDLVVDGREVRFCQVGCRQAFEADPAAGLARVDAVLIADQLPHYPLTVSIVDGRPLGPSPIDFIWGNRLFRAADEADRATILADPASFMEKLDRAVIAAQRPTYGMPDKCPVQGDILSSDQVIDFVVANRMVRVCCGRCVQIVRARPYQYLALIEYANREARAAGQP